MKLIEKVINLSDFKDEQIRNNIHDFTSSLLDIAKRVCPENPYSLLADKFEDMSNWNKKDWEFLFKRPLSFKDIRDAQITFEKIAQSVRQLADDYANVNENLNEEEYKYIDNTEILKLSPKDDLKVYRNFAKDYETLRALIVGEDIYLWDAKKFTHDQVADSLFGEDFEIYNQFMFDTRFKQLDDYSVRNTIDMVEFDKGTELAEQWYNDFFKYYEIIKNRLGVDFSEEGLKKVAYLKSLRTLTEKFEEIADDMFATNSAYDVINQMKNKPKPIRLVYDKDINYYFIGDAYSYIHQDILEEAFYQGFYPDMLSSSDARDKVDNYEVLLFAFYPSENHRQDLEKSSDGYTRKYVYDFGTIYSHEMTPLEDFEIYNILGEPNKKETILENEYQKLNKHVLPFLESVETLKNGFYRYSNGEKINGYTMSNPVAHDGRYYIDISPKVKQYLETCDGTGIITSGAEGTHTTLLPLSHSSGNKIDVQSSKGKYTTNMDYAETLLPFIKNPKTAYVFLEHFTESDAKEILHYLENNYNDLKSTWETITGIKPCTRAVNQLLTFVPDNQAKDWDRKGDKHLDICIK